jgi:beta-aspartyl-peptidase (threonine type)
MATTTPGNVAIVVHGGAYKIPDEIKAACKAGCERAAAIGFEVLQQGGTSVMACEMAIRELENDPVFDAGFGSVLNENGDIEMDAVIQDGRTLECGAVAGVSTVAHPISLARMVMSDTDHCLLIGQGADRFAMQMGVETVTREQLVTPIAQNEYERFKDLGYGGDQGSVVSIFNAASSGSGSGSGSMNNTKGGSGHDTVRAVAVDMQGNVAAGTSTGGITFKKQGRVGDSPLIGCGCLADNDTGACSVTGHGESAIKTTLASRVTSQIQDLGIQESADAGIEYMLSRVGGRGGVIVCTKDGRIAKACSTERMCWASHQNIVLSDGKHVHLQGSGVEPGDNIPTIAT